MLHISNYHTTLLLAILGGMALILLGLFLVLICYCRRRCRKRRQQQQRRKLAASAALENSKKDQSTSMSHINLISAVHMESMSSAGETDVHTPMLKPGFAAQPRDFSGPRGGDELPRHKVARELSSRTRSTVCRDSTDTLPGSRDKFHRSTDTLQLTPAHSELLLQKTPEKMGEGPFRHLHREEQYRRSTSSDQPSVDEHAAAGKAPQDHHHHHHHQRGPSLPRAELQEAVAADKKSADNLMSRSVDALARPVNLPGQVTGQLLCYSSVDQMNDPRYHKMMQHTLVIPAHYVQLQQQYMLNPSESEGSKQQHQSHSQHQQYQQHLQHHQHQMQQQQSQQQQQMYPHSHHPLQQQESPRTESDREESPHMAESISIPVTLSEAAMSKLNMEIQGLTEKHLLDLGDLKPMKHPRAWFISLDGRSNSTVRHSYIDLQRSERSGSQDASLDSGVDVGESSKPGRKISEEGRQRHQSCGIGGGGGGSGTSGIGGGGVGVAGGTVYTRLLFAGDRSESETAVCTPEDSSLKPLLSGDSRREDTLALSPDDDDDDDDDDDTDAQMPTEYLSHLQSPPEYHHGGGGGKGHGDYMVQTAESEYAGERRKNSSSYSKEQPPGAEYASEPRPAKAEAQQTHPGIKHQAGEFGKMRRPTDFSGKMKRAPPREQQPRSPDDGSEDDQGGDKKSPWQKREERPLMVFNLK